MFEDAVHIYSESLSKNLSMNIRNVLIWFNGLIKLIRVKDLTQFKLECLDCKQSDSLNLQIS
jgi:hypothetical protein